MFQDRENVQQTLSPPTRTRGLLPQNAFNFELQYLLRSPYFNITTGVGYFDIDEKVRITLGIPAFPPFFDRRIALDIRHLNAYSYANLNLVKDVTFTAGASFDYVDGDRAAVQDGKVSQFNPKFGILWNPLPGTAVRAGLTRVVKRTLITDQTLEPTQVAGFNQFFDDLNIATSWRYGAAIDQKFARDLFGGLEFSKRDLESPVINSTATPPTNNTFDRKEYLSRAYLFWTPHPMLSLKTGYSFERFRNDIRLGAPTTLNTHRVPVGLSFFHPSGLSTSFLATYHNQAGKFVRSRVCCESGRDDFLIADALLNYRLPKRYGFVTVGANNLFDKKFKYFEVDRDNPQIQPDRMLFIKLTMALP
jgi:outer membrane receptor protein involved in Fe transport